MDGMEAQISVAQYFRQQYNISLDYPNLPAIQAGSDTKPIYLPMEVFIYYCVINSLKLCSLLSTIILFL